MKLISMKISNAVPFPVNTLYIERLSESCVGMADSATNNKTAREVIIECKYAEWLYY